MFADGNSVNGVRSLETQTELLEYATNVFPKHLHALVEIGDLNGAVEEYSRKRTISSTLTNICRSHG